MTTIYDFGANVGLNIPYYLLKADKVVAVEANARLAASIAQKHAAEVASGRLVVVNRAVTTNEATVRESATFFIYQGNAKFGHVWSSLVRPLEGGDDFVEAEVALTHPAELFDTYGEPHFVKIDIEHHDTAVLQDILLTPQVPPYLSVEAHDPRILGLLLLDERFTGFKLIRGRHVARDFDSHLISSGDGPIRWSFLHHSAGPFGQDIPGPWLDRPSLVQHFGDIGPGWVDIHATSEHAGCRVPRDPLPTGVGELLSLSVRSGMRVFPAAASALLRRLPART